MANKILVKRGTNLSNAGTPAAGELLYKTDTRALYVGDGSTAATSLTAIAGSGGDGDITSVVAGTGLSGGATSGAATLNVDASQTQITSIGTIGTGVWNGSVIASAYLDADTAHLSTTQTFTGAKTFSSTINLNSHLDMGDGDRIKLGDSDDLQIVHDSNINFIHSTISDRDIYFRVNDGGASVDAIIIDASENGRVKLPNDLQELTFGVGGDGVLYSYQDDFWIQNVTQDQDIKFRVNDGGVHTDALFIQGSTTNVGIGTTSPDERLSVVSGSSSRTAHFGRYEDNGLFLHSEAAANDSHYNWMIQTQENIDGGLEIHPSASVGGYDWVSAGGLAIKRTGEVGIGTNSPAQKLHVAGNVMISNNQFFIGEDADGDDINLLGIHSNNNCYVGPSSNAWAGGAMLYGAASGTNAHVWYEGDAERMRIADNGFLGIGTASPEGKVHIFNGDASVAPDSDGDELVVENSSRSGISILSGTGSGSVGSIIFGSSDDG